MARPSRRSATSALGLLLLLGANGALALPPHAVEREAPPLRPCCALGSNVGVVVSGVRMPFVVDNVVAPGALGRHRLAGRTAFDERNGLVATCRGGVVDVGHARTAADLVAWSYAHVRAAGLGAARLELPTADGGVVITLTSTLGDARAADARALRVAARVAWALARQHERVTWQGARSFSAFSEAFSAFSPEDLYSDLLGVHLARRALADPAPWDEAMTDAIDATLAALGAVDAATTRRALDRRAGVWWAPDVAVPSGALLRARRFDVGPRLAPWPALDGAPACAGAPPLALDAPPPLEPREATLVLTAHDGAIADDALDAAIAELRARAVETSSVTIDDAAARRASSGDWGRRGAIQLFPLALGGGAATSAARPSLDAPRPLGVFSVRGGHADAAGGALTIVHLASALGDGRLAARFHGVEARGLFTCRDGEGAWRMPVAAWFQDCTPGGGVGVDGLLGAVQLDGGTGRQVLRPLELGAALDVLQTAFTEDFARRRLVAVVGASVDAYSRPGGPEGVVPRGHVALRFALRSPTLAWGLELDASARPALDGQDDHAVELGLRLSRRFALAPSPTSGVPLLTLAWTLDAGWSWWSRPEASMSSLPWPVASDRAPHTVSLVTALGVSFDRVAL